MGISKIDLKHESCILRTFQSGDEYSLLESINDRRVARDTSNIPYPYTLFHADAWISEMLRNEALGVKDRFDFAIEHDGKVIGSVALINIDEHKAQISYWLTPSFWGKGVMTVAVKALLRYAFSLGFVRIYAYTYDGNESSKAVLQRAGLRLEGVFKKEWFKNGKYYDSFYYAIVDDDWNVLSNSM